MSSEPFELDVRPVLRDGGEPFELIMQAIGKLAPGQAFRLLATFRPDPLFAVLGARGYAHAARELADGDWEIMFTPTNADAKPAARPEAVSTLDDADWPAPLEEMDVRDLPPPEPMVQILGRIEAMRPGTVLAARLDREPMFLFPELAKRGHGWQGAFTVSDDIYELRILVDGLRR